MDEYCTTKYEAEDFIINKCEHIIPCMLRPGFIVDKEDRSWSVPLKFVVDIFGNQCEQFSKKIPVVGPAVDFLFPAPSV